MLAKGLGERLEAQRAGRVEPPQNDHRRDPETMLLNPRGIAAYSVALADVVERVIDMGEFPVVLGGDCSIMLGGLLALGGAGVTGCCFSMVTPISISRRRSRMVRRHRWNLRSPRAAVLLL